MVYLYLYICMLMSLIFIITLILNCMKPNCWFEIGKFHTKLFRCKLINRNRDQTERHGTFLKERKFDGRHRFTLNLSDIDINIDKAKQLQNALYNLRTSTSNFVNHHCYKCKILKLPSKHLPAQS